jgi:hypothetical protein
MKKNYIIIFCLMLVIGAVSNISFGNEIRKADGPNFLIEIIPISEDVPWDNADIYPIVEILYPENGTDLPSNYLEVIGYAMDPDGMTYMEWTYQLGSYIYYDNETFGLAQYVNFRIQVFNLQPGTHTVTVVFYDIYNNTGSDSVTVYYEENSAPEKPNRPEGPESGTVGTEYTYSTHSTDADDDKIKYGWDWDGDNVVDEWTGFYPSGEIVNTSHIWNYEGIYNVKVKAQDEKGGESGFSSPLTVHIISNNPPNKPTVPSGSTAGVPGISYSYSTSTVDPDGDKVYYMFNWDDGTEPEWEGSFESGSSVSFSHIWNAKGTYSIKVKAKDDPNGDGDLSDGLESVWSDPLPITMPKAKSINLLENLLSKLPFLKYFLSSFFF